MWRGFLLILGVTMAGCGEDAVTPTTGSLEVSVSTGGGGTDDDGYVVDLDGGSATAEVGVDGSVTLTVDEGTHSVELTGVAEACSVDSDNPVSVSVVSDETATVTFSVTCTSD